MYRQNTNPRLYFIKTNDSLSGGTPRACASSSWGVECRFRVCRNHAPKQFSARDKTICALLLTNGLTLEEAAEESGISKNTARTHLRAIFSKTGVTRQATLVRILLGSVVPLG